MESEHLTFLSLLEIAMRAWICPTIKQADRWYGAEAYRVDSLSSFELTALSLDPE